MVYTIAIQIVKEVFVSTCIASERARLGLSQTEMAEKISLSRITYAKYERDPMGTPYRYLAEIAKLCGCSIEYLVGSTDERLPREDENAE